MNSLGKGLNTTQMIEISKLHFRLRDPLAGQVGKQVYKQK